MIETQTKDLHIFGIRHHGPGSARSLRHALEELQPDIILVEGPPDADSVIPLLNHKDMQPPVALLVYAPDQPQQAVYYPFAVFSPEWQAIHYALTNNIPVRFMDLPQYHRLGVRGQGMGDGGKEIPENPPETINENPPTEDLDSETQHSAHSTQNSPAPDPAAFTDPQPPTPSPQIDPLGWLAEAAGYSDGERWWEHMVEQRQDSVGLFTAILEAMTAMRQAAPLQNDPIEPLREAYMRQTIRAARQEGYKNIAVVCGAWHSPVLAEMPPAKEDETLLKKLPKTKTAATWVPWTYGRLAYESGYGAGVESPGWYHHLWTTPQQPVIRWLTRVAHLLREEDLDASSAHIIEATRLAESIAALRDRPLPGLPELNEAVQTVFCFGSDVQMQLIRQKLIVGETLGQVPDETPMVPLQQDLTREQRRLRLTPEAFQRSLDLDLRKQNDLERSLLLHRLDLLKIAWGKAEEVEGKHGTFHEIWKIQWQPEFAVAIIEAAIWGNTVYAAATAFVKNTAEAIPELPNLTELLNRALLADLPEAVAFLMTRLETQAALSSDVAHLMGALPPLAQIMRYTDVRKTDTAAVAHIIDGLVKRICIGLPGACASLNDDAAEIFYKLIIEVNSAIGLLQNQEHTKDWQTVLQQMANQQGLHGLIAGRSCRILLDSGFFSSEDMARRLGLALSTASDPAQAAAWVEGFLKGSGLLLLHDDALWQVLDEWVTALSPETFVALLPLLRRTFSTFVSGERRQMGEKVRQGPLLALTATTADFDLSRAEAVLPLVAQLLGVGK